MRQVVAAVFVGLVSGWPSALVQAQQPPTSNPVQRALSAVVTLRTFDAQGQPVASGSGFFLPDGRIATNRHVLVGARAVEVRLRGGVLAASFDYAEQVGYSTDLAILPRIANAPIRLSLASALPTAGDRLYVIGAPLGLDGTVSDGIVSALRTTATGTVMQMTAPISPGSSGGPVLNARGDVVGVATSKLVDGESLNFAVVVDDLRALYGSPAGRFSFPAEVRAVAAASAPNNSSAPQGRDASASRPSLDDIIPSAPVGSAQDPEFTIQSYGCYGNVARTVVVCLADFVPHQTSRKELTVWSAVLSDASQNAIAADAMSSGTFTGANIKMWTHGQRMRVALRFVTTYTPDVWVALGMKVGGQWLTRDWTYPMVQIKTVDGSKGQYAHLFGATP
jgi:hypothetical protein